MGDCRFCGHPAGMFRSQHKDCEERHTQAITSIRHQIAQAIVRGDDGQRAVEAVKPLGREGFVRGAAFTAEVIAGWEAALERFLDDGILTEDEERCILGFAQSAGLLDQVQPTQAYERIVKVAVLRDLQNGVVPNRVSLNGPLPINLQRGESIIWAFPGTEYLEERERREFVGRSQGVSVRVMKGVYYRVGSFKGRPVTRQERVSLGKGTLFVTNKHLTFAGDGKSVRIPYAKIVSFEQFSDGIGIMRDAATAKPQIFRTGDGWFASNLVGMVAQS